MPIYTYTCKNCLKKFDILVGMTQEKTDLKCPDCGSFSLEKGFATFSVAVSGHSDYSSCNGNSSGGCSSCSGGSCSSCSH